MAFDWVMAAVIVAIAVIPLMISSTAADFLQAIGQFLRSLIWPKTAQCDSLLWSDMPSDSRLGIHDCGPAPAACLHRSNRTSDHLVAPECWNSTLAIMFNRGWNSHARRARASFPKPRQLEANKSYLRTDVTTILAFFVYATSKYVMNGQVTSERLKEFGNGSSIYGMRFASAEVRFEEIPPLPKGGEKSVLVAHLKGLLPEASIPTKLTKNELQNLIAGYPPFYRETFQSRPSAQPIPYPIKSLRDAHVRGVWIIAVGIAAATIFLAVPLYFDPLPTDSNDSVDPCDGWGESNSPLTRVLNTLKLIKTAYASSGTAEEKLNIQATINAVTMMHGTRTESNVKSFIIGTDLDAIVPITLSNQQCKFVLELFSKNVTSVDVLGVGDQVMLHPILLQVLYVTLWGAIEVVRYYKDNLNDIRIPELLIRYDKVVYLRDCVDDNED